MFKQYKLKNYKFILIALVVILNTIGVALVGSASPGDQKKQIIGMVSGIIIMLLVSYIDYNFILRFSWLIYLGAIGLLGLVIVAGEQSKGAQRWFKIGGFQFQPSELVKILMILFLAAIQKIPTELYESATLDGASKWQQFKCVTLPMLGQMFQVISMMCILNGFQLFDSVKVLTGGGPGNQTSVMALYIYNYFFNSTGAQQGYASAVSVCATFITAAVGALYFLVTSKKFKEN